MATEQPHRHPRQTSPLPRQRSEPAAHGMPLPIFSFVLSHAGEPLASPCETQITGYDSGHVDNPADRVKFRRPRQPARSRRKRKNRRETRENSDGGCRPEQNLPQAFQEKAWHEVVLQDAQAQRDQAVPYVPDRVLTTLIKNIHADPFFTTFPTAREEEASASSPGVDGRHARRRVDADQRLRHAGKCAGFAGDPLSDPLIMFVSERGTLGEFITVSRWFAAPCGRAQLAGDGASHRHPAR